MRRGRSLFLALVCCLLAWACLDPNKPKGGIPAADWRWVAQSVNAYPARDWVDANVKWGYDPAYCLRVNAPACVSSTSEDPAHPALTVYVDVPALKRWINDPVAVLWHEIGHAIKPSAFAPEEKWAACAARALIGREPLSGGSRVLAGCHDAGLLARAQAHLRSLGIPTA